MGGTGSGRRRVADAIAVRYEVERKLGGAIERIKELRASQTDDQKWWLDIAESALAVAEHTLTEVIEKERLASRQIGSIEHFIKQAEEGKAAIGR